MESQLIDMPARAPEDANKEVTNLGYVSKPGIKLMRQYYDEYLQECQELALPHISFSGFVVDMCIRGYLDSKEQRRKKVKIN